MPGAARPCCPRSEQTHLAWAHSQDTPGNRGGVKAEDSGTDHGSVTVSEKGGRGSSHRGLRWKETRNLGNAQGPVLGPALDQPCSLRKGPRLRTSQEGPQTAHLCLAQTVALRPRAA